ncbi:MAG: hypothetical protein ACRDY6_12080 [Acidimicrobiia bacterium]
MRELKREGRIDDAIGLLQGLVDVVEDEAATQSWGIAPWYYEQLAICFRKQKDYAAEVAILERYDAWEHAAGAAPPELFTRLQKARRLLSRKSDMS